MSEHKMTPAPHVIVKPPREAECPRCHESCGWCSDYRWHHGKMLLPGSRKKCTIEAMHPDPACPVCAGSRRVMMTVTIQCEAIPHA